MQDLPSKKDSRDQSNSADIVYFIQNLSKQDNIHLAMFLSGLSGSDIFIKLLSVFEDEFPIFLSLMNDNSFKVPNIKTLCHYKVYIKIYLYLSKYQFSEFGYEKASKIFGRRIAHLKSIILKVQGAFDSLKIHITSASSTIDGIDDIVSILGELKLPTISDDLDNDNSLSTEKDNINSDLDNTLNKS